MLDNADKEQKFDGEDIVSKTIEGKSKVKLKTYDIVSAAYEDAELGQFENMKNNQDSNEVLGADVLNDAVEMVDHQHGNFENVQKGSKIYLSQNSSTSEHIESLSYELYQKSDRNTESPNSIHVANIQENSEIMTTERVEEFLEQHAANDNNGPTVDDDNPPAMVIRSVTLN